MPIGFPHTARFILDLSSTLIYVKIFRPGVRAIFRSEKKVNRIRRFRVRGADPPRKTNGTVCPGGYFRAAGVISPGPPPLAGKILSYGTYLLLLPAVTVSVRYLPGGGGGRRPRVYRSRCRAGCRAAGRTPNHTSDLTYYGGRNESIPLFTPRSRNRKITRYEIITLAHCSQIYTIRLWRTFFFPSSFF